MKGKNRLPLIITKVEFLPATDNLSRKKLKAVLRLLLDATPAKEASAEKQQREETTK